MAQAERARRRRKIRELAAVVAEARRETPDTVSLFLDAGDEPLDYEAGQFITIDPHQFESLQPLIEELEQAKGSKEKPRAYSMASAPHEPFVRITIKQEQYWPGESRYQPLLSPLLVDDCPAGTPITFRGFTGPYTLPADPAEREGTILHVCAGSGIVPNLALINHSLHVDDGLQHVLLYSSKTRQDIIYYEEFAELARAHGDRVDILHCITREDPGDIEPAARRGRIDRELIESRIDDPERCFVYSCGPGILPWERKEAKEKGVEPEPKFIEHMLETLLAAGIPAAHIKQESWG